MEPEVNRTSHTGASMDEGGPAAIPTSNGTIEMYDVDDNTIAVVVPIVFSLIFILSFIGNGCIIHAVLRYKSMRTAPNLFIVNLAFGDILMALFSVPTSGLKYTLSTWVFGEAVCKISYIVRTLSQGVSIFTLTVLSIDRVLVISRTMKVRQEKTNQRILAMMVVVWILAILLAIPDGVAYKTVNKEYPTELVTFCWPTWNQVDYLKIHATVQIVVLFLIPLVIISICYGLMARIMVKSAHSIPGESIESSTWRQKQIRMRKKVAKIVVVLIVLFFACWCPRNVMALIAIYFQLQMTPTIYYIGIVSYCLQFTSCCVNPIALYFLNKSFKRYYIKTFCCAADRLKASETDLTTKQSNMTGECQVLTRVSSAGLKPSHDDTDNTESSLSRRVLLTSSSS